MIYPVTVTVRYLNLCLTEIVVFINSYRLQKMTSLNSELESKIVKSTLL